MDFVVSANTDIGTTRSSNQDSLSVKVIDTSSGRMVMAVLCDGMGGYSKGEVASAAVIRAFDKWARVSLPRLTMCPIDDGDIRDQWTEIIRRENRKICDFGAKNGIKVGTTAVAILITQSRYYCLNIGDSRCYKITDCLSQISEDQTLVQKEVNEGKLTKEQAETDKRNNILLQCIGSSKEPEPDMYYGPVTKDMTFMLCSDGFRHLLKKEEIFENFNPKVLTNSTVMQNNTSRLIDLNKSRGEKDNISVALIRTYQGN